MLDDVKHVEAVAVVRALIESPGDLRANLAAQQFLKENHPPPEAYMAAMSALATPRGLGGSVSVHLRYGILGWRWGSEKAEPSDVEYAAYPVDLAESRERVIEAAQRYRYAVENPGLALYSFERDRLVDALAALDALEAPDTEGGS